MNEACPCCSGKSYSECCEKYHEGALPEDALALMRSRYSAYAFGLASYIIETTHPKNPNFSPNQKQWTQEIENFHDEVSFEGLEILSSTFGEKESFVTFVAYLSEEGEELTFTEKSRFLKEGERWLYVDGKTAAGRVPTLP